MRLDFPMKEFEELMDFSPSSPFCMFTYYSDNLGDHIQTLALLQHVKPKTLLPRDRLTPQNDLCLLANGWLTIGAMPNKKDFRLVRYVGVHLAPHCRNMEAVNAMRGCGVIGSRDGVTADFLAANGMATHFTGCATLTFPRYAGRREGVFCVDVPDDIKEKAAQIYKDPVFVSHDLGRLSLDQVDEEVIAAQYRRAYRLLMNYMKAELVITSRVHTALPCVAFGTPVIYVGVPASVDDRVGLLEWLGIGSVSGSPTSSIPDLRKPRPIDPLSHRERYLGFLQQCVSEALAA